MVPMAIHQVLCGISVGLVKLRVGVDWLYELAVLDGADVDYLGLIRGELELGNS